MGRNPGDQLPISDKYFRTIRNTNPMTSDEPMKVELTDEGKVVLRKILNP